MHVDYTDRPSAAELACDAWADGLTVRTWGGSGDRRACADGPTCGTCYGTGWMEYASIGHAEGRVDNCDTCGGHGTISRGEHALRLARIILAN